MSVQLEHLNAMIAQQRARLVATRETSTMMQERAETLEYFARGLGIPLNVIEEIILMRPAQAEAYGNQWRKWLIGDVER